jgi:hypothetical protein
MKQTLLQYPSELVEILKPFENDFTKPQYSNFKQSITCMAVSSHATIEHWSKLFDPKHQTTLDRFFIESPWNLTSVKSRFNRITSRFLPHTCVGILDDTLSHKPFAKKMEMLGVHYDHLNGGHETGHSIVTSGYATHSDFLPHDAIVYIRKENCTDAISFQTKNDIASTMIKDMAKQKKLFCFVFDTWYSNTQIIGAIKEAKKHYCTEIKENRNVTLSRKQTAVREHAKHISEKQYAIILIDERKFKVFSCSAFISGIGTVHLLFCRMWQEEKKEWSDMHYIISDLLSFSEEAILRLYLMRGGIESFHREAKQHIGLESYQLRKSRGIERYLFLVLMTYAFLIMLKMLPYGRMRCTETIGDVCRALREDCYTNLLKNSREANWDQIRQAAKQLAEAY